MAMESTYRCVKYRGVPSVCRCSSALFANNISTLYVVVVIALNVNATEVRGTYRQMQQKRRAVKLSSDPRIIGGTPAASGAFPFHVSGVDPDGFCGGTLIAPDRFRSPYPPFGGLAK